MSSTKTNRVSPHPLAQRVRDGLPKCCTIEIHCEADYYGASRWIAESLAKKKIPRSRVGWQHGWANGPITDPRQVIGRETDQEAYLVANLTIERFLRQRGVSAKAVGLPMVYAPTPIIDPIGSSVLVMPAHTTHDSKHTTDIDAYVDYVVSLRDHYENVCASVTQSCVQHGYWVDDFDRAGIAWVSGAAIDDGNALLRMRTLFSMFECMTSNAIGSHFAYAAAHGCRLSLSGPPHIIVPEDLTGVGFYQENPDLIDLAIDRSARSTIEKKYPHLVSAPEHAKSCKQWGIQEIGADCKKSPKEMKSALRWNWSHRVQRNFYKPVGYRQAA